MLRSILKNTKHSKLFCCILFFIDNLTAGRRKLFRVSQIHCELYTIPKSGGGIYLPVRLYTSTLLVRVFVSAYKFI